MKSLKYFWLSIIRPKKLFVLLSDRPSLIDALSIILAIGFVNGLQVFLNRNMVEPQQLQKKSDLIVRGLYPAIYGSLIILQTCFKVLWDVLCIRLSFAMLKIKVNIKSIFAAIAFSFTPLVIRDTLAALLNIEDKIMIGPLKLYYYKTSLMQIIARDNLTNKYVYYLLSQAEVFTIWSFVLSVIAVSMLGKTSYKASFTIMFFAWLVSSFISLHFAS